MRSEKRDRLDALCEELAADLQPARPLYPHRWCLYIVLLGFGLELAVLWLVLGLRADAAVLGPLWLWGPAVLSVTMGAVLIGLALRAVVPGNLPAAPTLVFCPLLGLGLSVLLSLAIYTKSQTAPPPGEALRVGLLCLGMEICLGAPIALIFLLLVRRGLSANPFPVAVAGTFGVVLVTDAAWRLVCRYSDPTHVTASHAPGMVAVVLLSACLASIWDRHQRRRWLTRLDND